MTESQSPLVDALCKGATHWIYPGDDIFDVDRGMAGHPNPMRGQVIDGEVIDLMSDGGGKGQIGSGTLRALVSSGETLENRLLGAIIFGKWPVVAWIYCVTCAKKKTLELLAIKRAERTLKIPLPDSLTVRFVLQQVHLEYPQVIDL